MKAGKTAFPNDKNFNLQKGRTIVDRTIIKLLAQKDQKAINLIEEKYEKLIRYIAGTILYQRESDIEECVNDVYMKLWMYGSGYDYEKASLKTYIKVITRNTALNHLRKIRTQEEHLEIGEPGEILDEYIDYRQNPEREMIQKENVESLQTLLEKMKKKDKELVLRRFYYMQSTRQIAMAMDMSENAVDSKLSRIRKKFKLHFEKEIMK